MARTRAAFEGSPLTADLKTLVEEEIKEDFARLANREGMSTSEYLRNLIYMHVRGKAYLIKVLKERLDRMSGFSSETDD